MHILVLIAAVWGGFFLLSLVLAVSNSRSRTVAEPTTTINFRVHPLLLPGDVEQLKPLREIVTSKLNSSIDRNGNKETIYVIDDDPDILKLIQHVLELEGFEVVSFKNPQDALSEFNRAAKRPGMVVTDYCMEPMNGLELIQRCRETQPNIKTIMISGMVDGKDFHELPEKTDRFLSKPFKVSNLIQTLHDTMVETHN